MSYAISSLKKGLVFHAPLKGKLGTDLVTGWDFTVGWSNINSTDTANTITTTANGGSVRIDGFTEVGKTYKLRIAGTNTGSSAGVYSYGGSQNITGTSCYGSSFDFTISYTATATGILIYGGATGTTLTITRFELQEVLPSKVSAEINTSSSWVANNWAITNAGTGTLALSGGDLVFTNCDSSDARAAFKTDAGVLISTTVGKTYYWEMDIEGYTAGLFHLNLAGNDATNSNTVKVVSSNGTFSGVHTVVSGSANQYIYFKKGASIPTGSCTLSRLVVREVETPDVTPNSNNGTVYGATQNSTDNELLMAQVIILTVVTMLH
jgi:hypothetical protein